MGDYAVLVHPDILVAQPGRKSVSDKAEFAKLRGARLVTTGEIEKGERLAEGTVKRLTETVSRASTNTATASSSFLSSVFGSARTTS